MMHDYWNTWYSGWGWMLWFGVLILFFSSLGNWGYTYSAHMKYSDFFPNKRALDILNARYARGEISHEEYARTKSAMTDEGKLGPLKPV